MRPELLEALICSDDRECREDLERVRDVLARVNKIASSITFNVTLEKPGKPLIKHIRNIDSIRRILAKKLGDEDLVDYTLRRALYLKLNRKIKVSRDDTLCPLCGNPPTLIFFRKSDSGLFSGDIPHARCTCGMEWEYDEWRCPQCMATGRGHFDIMVSRDKPVELRACKRCGFTLFVARRITGDRDYFHALANIIIGGVKGGTE